MLSNFTYLLLLLSHVIYFRCSQLLWYFTSSGSSSWKMGKNWRAGVASSFSSVRDIPLIYSRIRLVFVAYCSQLIERYCYISISLLAVSGGKKGKKHIVGDTATHHLSTYIHIVQSTSDETIAIFWNHLGCLQPDIMTTKFCRLWLNLNRFSGSQWGGDWENMNFCSTLLKYMTTELNSSWGVP